jgi:hypothetical protein
MLVSILRYPSVIVEGIYDHDPEFETDLRKWLQSWIYDHVDDYDYYPLPEYLLSKQHIAEVSRLSFPVEQQAICNFLGTAIGVGDLGEDIQSLIEFIINRKSQLLPSAPMSQPVIETSPHTQRQRSNRPGRKRMLTERDANIPTRNCRKR